VEVLFTLEHYFALVELTTEKGLSLDECEWLNEGGEISIVDEEISPVFYLDDTKTVLKLDRSIAAFKYGNIKIEFPLQSLEFEILVSSLVCGFEKLTASSSSVIKFELNNEDKTKEYLEEFRFDKMFQISFSNKCPIT